MLKISAIDIKKLKQNQFQEEIPEFFELRNFVEKNDWHNNVSVFDHTLAVLEELGKLLKRVDNRTKSYLNQKIGNYTRKDLLFLGTLFHDISKSDTFARMHNSTSCPKHEERGGEKVKSILNRFDLSEREKSIVSKIVRYHGEIHYILDPLNDRLEE